MQNFNFLLKAISPLQSYIRFASFTSKKLRPRAVPMTDWNFGSVVITVLRLLRLNACLEEEHQSRLIIARHASVTELTVGP